MDYDYPILDSLEEAERWHALHQLHILDFLQYCYIFAPARGARRCFASLNEAQVERLREFVSRPSYRVTGGTVMDTRIDSENYFRGRILVHAFLTGQ